MRFPRVPAFCYPRFPATFLGAVWTVVLMTLSLSAATSSAEIPEVLAAHFAKDKTVSGEVGAIMPPEEINKYIAKVQAASKANPEWYSEYAKEAKPGIPLPWHENLGLSKEDYEDYIKLWDQRQF